ncbi:Lamina-associated polypeptide 2, isoforms beta/delta/epsilon/gamma [Merluccius polli]|uniref:Lamina-associated polypeptide 2, isoforms beta/delta/epsilon/gamma n=1 Tax=Merluccius polli TaxID=89951 RepID=A0AA47P7I7_MERPO|nr:Lamina-associated polypeptide 2, isoforms beta/delta/epsilon/gamma [Merluccius polli]
MAEYLEDPSVLTKDKLKHELTANSVPLPGGEHKKEVYVQLYLKHLTAQNRQAGAGGGGGAAAAPLDAFSSDEELPAPVVSNRMSSPSRRDRDLNVLQKAARKTDRPRTEETDVTDLTDEDLREQLVKHGVDTGPIVASTRKLYEKKLQKVLDEPPPDSPIAAEAAPDLTALADSNQNGNTHSDQYSDKEDEEIAAPEPVPVVEKSVRSRGKIPVTTRTSSRRQTKVVEEVLTSGNQTPAKGSESVVEDILANEISSPLGISATCRRPIRGAAGRPLKPSEYWLDPSLLQRSVHTTSRAYSESVSRGCGAESSSGKAAPARRSFLCVLLRLLLLAAAAASLYYAYNHLDVKQVSTELRALLDSAVVPLQAMVDGVVANLGLGGGSDAAGEAGK